MFFKLISFDIITLKMLWNCYEGNCRSNYYIKKGTFKVDSFPSNASHSS